MKKLSEVINNEGVLKKIYNANKKLQEQCVNESLEIELNDIVEEIKTLEGINYSIDMYKGSNIYINNNYAFIRSLYNNVILAPNGIVETSYNKGDKNLIKRLLQGLNNLYFMDYNNKNYDQLENWVKEKSELLKDKLVNEINNYINKAWKDEYIYDYFINIFCDYINAENFFYDEITYILYENVVKRYS